jgi:hypothetical protein
VTDAHAYHLVINSGKLGYQEASGIIVEAASRWGEGTSRREGIDRNLTAGMMASANENPSSPAQ